METGKVLKDRLLIKQEEALEKTAGGIILPNLEGEKPNVGKVIISESDQIAVGDTVYFADHAGKTFVLDEDALSLKGEYVLLVDTQVLFIKTEK